MKLNCLIVEDEPLAAKVIENYLSKIDMLRLSGVCYNAIDAFNVLNKKKIDLIFLDIKMPQITGLEFLKTLKSPPKVIFTTAYREYALDGYELDIVDYLLKPISFERFLKAINKVLNQNETKVIEKNAPLSFIDTPLKQYIYVKSDKKNIKVYFKNILYIEGLKDYINIVTNEGKIISYLSLAYMENELPSEKFVRIHRSYIVSLDRIKAYSATSIELPGKILTIGRYYKKHVLSVLDQDCKSSFL